MRAALLLLPIVLFAAPSRGIADPLFERMQGEWTAAGERIQYPSGRAFQIRSTTHAEVQGERLVSRNEITETALDGTIKSYRRDYWVRPDPDLPGGYFLGVGDQVTSRGRFEAGMMELQVEQNLGGEPPLVVRSRTRFEAAASQYEESAWHGNRQLSQTRLRYLARPESRSAQ